MTLPRFDAPTVLGLLQVRLTGAFLTPHRLRALIELPGHREPAGRLRTVVYGGSTMPPALLARAVERFGGDFIQGFGAGTEAGTQTVLTAEDHPGPGPVRPTCWRRWVDPLSGSTCASWGPTAATSVPARWARSPCTASI